MARNKFIIWLRLNWLRMLLIFLSAIFVFTVITLLVLGFSTFSNMESFSRKQMMAQMGMYLFMGIVQAIIYVVLFGFMQYYTFMGGGMSKMLGADAAEEAKPDVKWADVIGMETVKRDAWEIVEFLRDQTRLKAIGGKIIKGTLFMGPPGCGKTYLAKAIATEADMPFLAAVGSEFIGMIVGQGAARMRSLFKKARKLAKVYGGCIIFIDEMDSFATPRKQDMGFGGQTSHNATINQFLTEIDGLRKTENNIVVFAATNMNEEELDPAIIRSGRFDRKIRVDYPNRKDREDIVNFYLRRIKYEPKCDVATLAKETMWFSPADLDSLVREAAIFARRENAELVKNEHLQKAKDHLIGLLSKNGSKNMMFAQQHVYWDDIIGMQATKTEAWEIVSRMRDSRQAKGSSNRLARAYLFYGISGTGKTHFIKAVATEAGLPVVPMSAPDILAMSPNDGRAELKRIFEETRSLNRTEMGCILYISNIDVLVWDNRNISFYDTVQNFFLSELDNVLDEQNNIFILAETCLGEESLSRQLFRPNRFSQKIQIPRPGTADRLLLIKHQLKEVNCDLALDMDQLVRKTMWFSVNDIRSMIKETQLLASRDNAPANQEHFQKAIDKTVEIIEKATGGFIMATRVNISWDSVIGMDSAKKDAWEIVELMKDRERIKAVGGKVIKGSMMIGPPGCGKTYLAKAIATEAGLPFLSVAGSEFVGIYVGTGAEKVKQLFTEARSLAKAEGGCIVFIDEIDSFARPRRSDALGNIGAETAHNATINQFLTELDGLRKQENNIIVLAATNVSEDQIDSAIMRSGRFERVIHISRPNLKERKQLFQFYLKKVRVAEDVNLSILARKTLWFSPADIDHMVRESSLIAMRNKHDLITFKDLSEAYDRISYGTRSNITMTNKEKEWTAYHEAGHAIIGYIFLQYDDVIKATIIPRAGALGFVAPRGRHEVWSNDRESLRSKLKFGLASYAAETIKFGSTSTGVGGGPGSDFYRALMLAHNMVWSYGMGRSGLIGDFSSLSGGWSAETHISEKTREKLDEDVQAIMQECLKECFDTLNENRDLLEHFAQELLAKEELEYDEIESIFQKFGVKPKYRPPFLEEDEGNT
ncbi:MAG: AAA family ATPase [Candidatus Omnitrophica bacterium]|nr:AAA family ATPase [Candidatus Omnitrophota bacterium]